MLKAEFEANLKVTLIASKKKGLEHHDLEIECDPIKLSTTVGSIKPDDVSFRIFHGQMDPYAENRIHPMSFSASMVSSHLGYDKSVKLVFSSSTTIYGWLKEVPCTKEFSAANLYGRTKLMIKEISQNDLAQMAELADTSTSMGLSSVLQALRTITLHHDYLMDAFNLKHDGQRVATMLTYLTNNVEGGKTFLTRGKSVESDANLYDGSLDGHDSMGFGPLVPTEIERSLMERVRQELKHELKQLRLRPSMKTEIKPHFLAFEKVRASPMVMAISVISVSSDSSEDSVGTPARRVILFGTIPTTIPDTTPVITSPTTQTDTTSPASDSEFDPSEDPPSDHIPQLPAISTFLSSTDDTTDNDTPDTPPSPTHGTPFIEITSSTKISPVIPRRRVMILAPGQPIPYGRPYRYHLNGSVQMITVRKRVGPLPIQQLAVRHFVDHSSSDYFSLDDSAQDSSSDSSSEASSDFHSDASSDSSSRHSLSDHSSPDLLSTSEGPSCKRRRSLMTSVHALPSVSEALSPVRADLIPSSKRIKDSGYSAYAEGHRIVGVESAVTAMTKRIAELDKDNMRLRGTASVESQRVDRLQRGMPRIQRELRQIRQFRFYDRMRVGRFEACARKHMGYHP
ncbi:hypothetical protein Tco_1017847 [Tanacetum coccineum]|uniref:Uncharacterized protein n=1 Tax=Tanacetum coccineum TaxID=301880 RepID=A0ABQ5FV85_9ASTR